MDHPLYTNLFQFKLVANLARTLLRIVCTRTGLASIWVFLTWRMRLQLRTGLKHAYSWTATSIRLDPSISCPLVNSSKPSVWISGALSSGGASLFCSRLRYRTVRDLYTDSGLTRTSLGDTSPGRMRWVICSLSCNLGFFWNWANIIHALMSSAFCSRWFSKLLRGNSNICKMQLFRDASRLGCDVFYSSDTGKRHKRTENCFGFFELALPP
jgi:hypothetical protein